jgi:hypothetical protein
MVQLYLRPRDLKKCERSLRSKIAVRLTGLDGDGEVIAVRGVVKALESGHTQFQGYPLRITIPDAE